MRLATTWMNEEWYNDQIRAESDPDWVRAGGIFIVYLSSSWPLQRPNYETWLNQIVAAYQTHLDNKDRTFSAFLLDLPAVPSDVMSLLREMCVEPDR